MRLSKQGRYVYCYDCGCRLEKNGVCKICGHADNPLLPGMVPDVTGLTEEAAVVLLINPEAQLVLGDVYEDNDENVPVDIIISSDPVAGTQLGTGSPVDIVVSVGPIG